MKSKTKNRVGTGQVKEITKLHFRDAEVKQITELTEGMFNAAYLVEGDGLPESGIVLKIGPDADTETLTYEKEILRTEVEVYGMLKDKKIPIPKIYAYDFSRANTPYDYFFMQKINGGYMDTV